MTKVEDSKYCSKCKSNKPVTEFGKDRKIFYSLLRRGNGIICC